MRQIASAKAWTSSAVVSHAHIQRTTLRAGVPHVEAAFSLQRFDRLGRQDREDGVRLDRVGELHDVVEVAHSRGEQSRHRVRVGGVAQPEIVVQQRFELRGDEAHLRGQLHPLLAGEGQCRRSRRGRFGKTIASPNIIPFFVPPKVHTSTPVSTSIVRTIDAERGDRVRDAGAVEVEEQAALARRLAERAQFVDACTPCRPRSTARSRSRPAGRGADRRSVHLALDVVRRQLPVLDRDVDQLAAVEALERGALVDRQVGAGGADDGLVRPQRRRERDHVRAGAVEREEHARLVAEQRAEGGLGAARALVVAVAGGVAVVGGRERGEDGGVDAGVVVAGEVAVGHRPTTTARWLPMLPWC